MQKLPGMQEMQIRSVRQEYPLEEDMTTHSSILAWEIPWTEEPGGYSPWSHKEHTSLVLLFMQENMEKWKDRSLNKSYSLTWMQVLELC